MLKPAQTVASSGLVVLAMHLTAFTSNKNQLRLWAQFFNKKVVLPSTFQESIHQKDEVVVGHSTSIIVPATFSKPSHLNSLENFERNRVTETQ